MTPASPMTRWSCDLVVSRSLRVVATSVFTPPTSVLTLATSLETAPILNYEDVVGQPILNFQRKPIEPGIAGIPSSFIHIVHCQDDLVPQQPVVKHKQRSIEELELVVP